MSSKIARRLHNETPQVIKDKVKSIADQMVKAKERPILFSTPMVKAILEGRKTVTRRVVDIDPDLGKDVTKWGYSIFTPVGCISGRTKQKTETGHRYGEKWVKLKYGKPADALWVREAFYAYGYWALLDGKWTFNDSTLQYEGYRYIDNPPHEINEHRNDGIGWYKRPSIFMPRVASRITLKIKSISVERLHDITEDDAIKEGITPVESFDSGAGISGRQMYMNYLPWGYMEVLPKDSFESLWQLINGKESWESNPWVWRIEFEKL